ncbi:hypothetical protein ACFL2Q_05105 [Thermodesulfobacteriota bacterium]
MMGLDAIIYCDCFERGELTQSRLPEWGVYVDEEDGRSTTSQDLDMQLAFDRWNDEQECPHPGGWLLHHHIGNISLVEL